MKAYQPSNNKVLNFKKYSISNSTKALATKTTTHANDIKCPIIEPKGTLKESSAQELNEIDSSVFNKLLNQYERKAKEAINQINAISPPLPHLPISNTITPRESITILPKSSYVVKSQTSSLDNYKIGKEIGKGAYATVKIVTFKSTKEKFAMKIYERYRVLDKSKKTALRREIQIMKKIDHVNIVKLHEVIYTKKQIVVIMEYVNGRSLSDLTKDYQSRRIPEADCKQIFLQICKGMDYLHNLHISHRDIKLENILLDSSNTVKIIDFGFGVFSPEDGLQEFYCGTPNYMPPEIVLKNKYIGQYADLWSLGVLLFKLLCGEFPFRALNEKELYDVIKKGKYNLPNHLSEDAVNLINGLLLMDPFNRNHCDIVIMHKWFIINGIPIEIKEDKPDNKAIANESKEAKEAKDKESKDVKEEAKEEEEKEANM